MAAEYLAELLQETSQRVLYGCALPNGAIVAANINHPSYPNTAENYYYSWPRDAAYQMMAACVAKLPRAADIRRANLTWLEEKCLEYIDAGVFTKRTSPNGAPDRRYGSQYQPDQTGAYLWAAHLSSPSQDKQTDRVMRRLANGLVGSWQHQRMTYVMAGRRQASFDRDIQDLWENTTAEHDIGENFTYSLAVCVAGLNAAVDRLAHQGIETERSLWLKTKNEMTRILADDPGVHFNKKINPRNPQNNRLDASLLGLVYPLNSEQELFDEKAILTVSAIEQELYDDTGVIRYLGDTYDGIVRPHGEEASAGRWPLLTFWLAIAKNRLGQHMEAKKIYDRQLEQLGELYAAKQLPNGCIPEQIFPDAERQGKGILPLGWSHAKFLIATAELQA